MGTVRVVVLDVLGEHGLQVPAAEDEHPVEALAPQCADHTLTDRIGPWRSDGGLDGLDALCCEDGIERSGEVSRSRMRNVSAIAWSVSSIETLRACWVTHSATGLAVTPAIRTKRVSW